MLACLVWFYWFCWLVALFFFLFYVFSFSLLINLIFLKFFIYSTVLIPMLVWTLIVPHPIIPRHFFPFFIEYYINFSFSGMFSLVTFQILSIPFPSFPPSRKHPIISSLPLLLWGCSSIHPPTPTSLLSIPLHWGIYRAFIGPRTSPPIDAWEGHHLLHMGPESSVLLGWLISPWELWRV